MPKIGEMIGGWTIRHRLGRGGQAQVFAVSRREGEPEAAIKLINCRRAKFVMAPEQERGGVVDVGPTADVYALGKLLYRKRC